MTHAPVIGSSDSTVSARSGEALPGASGPHLIHSLPTNLGEGAYISIKFSFYLEAQKTLNKTITVRLRAILEQSEISVPFLELCLNSANIPLLKEQFQLISLEFSEKKSAT